VESYWQREAKWADRWVGETPRRADFAVLGGGFAGLATAIRIREREPSASVVVLEAERIGYGASGRSAGFLSPLAAPIWVVGASRSPEYAWGAGRMFEAMKSVARWVKKVAPECELAKVRYHMRSQGRLWAAALDVFSNAMHTARIPFGDVRNGVEMDGFTMHPYKLARELAEHAVAAGVQICEHARVRVIDAGGVILDNGRNIRARRVVACTNAYSSTIVTAEHVRAFIVYSAMAASAPMNANDGFTLTVGRTQTYQRTHAGRLLGGGLDGTREPNLAQSFGLIGGAPVDIAWSGKFQTTSTGLPVIRKDKLCVWNVAYGGTGLVLALACAPTAAAIACDAPPEELYTLMQKTRVPFSAALLALGRIAWGFAMPWSRPAHG
jgi:glycine/D-amino acid oxidase-like deaminating enzyme